ncbi:MAG: hypothetical protein A2231_12035 [Candidatus Firestonebacteria bacterium RIFOXYA2_FULL_40_8]|nr:MAG: hypothetical protein A2231_12035 [Candidatus Firestonebacteria bacterium RIFOXYA2_FULL_40_8]
MKKITRLIFCIVVFVSFASCGNNDSLKDGIPLKKRGITNPAAEKVPGFKYLLDNYNYGLEGRYEAGYYNPFEKIPNIREYKGFYILDLYPDSRDMDLMGYVVELIDVRRRVLDFRFYPGKPDFLSVKKDAKIHKFILYSVKLNGNYFEKGVYISQSYWEHVVIEEALKKNTGKFKQHSVELLEMSDRKSRVLNVRSDELMQNKQNFIWKLVALRWGGKDLQFIKVDVHESGIFTDDGLPLESLKKRYDFYSPGWASHWTKDAVVYGILCEVPAEWFRKLFKDRNYLNAPKIPEEKKEITDTKYDYYFQVIF